MGKGGNAVSAWFQQKETAASQVQSSYLCSPARPLCNPGWGALTTGTACYTRPWALHPTLIHFLLVPLWDLLKVLQSNNPFVQPDPTPTLQLSGPEVGIGRVQPIRPFLGILMRQGHSPDSSGLDTNL